MLNDTQLTRAGRPLMLDERATVTSSSVVARVKLCAIARNEGPYIADWVFHHLHFGFDAIEVWINGTEDRTGRIIKAVSAAHPQVTKRNADRFLAACLSDARHFQVAAYRRMAGRAGREGYSHIAFLDLDEYWTPLDFRSPIQSFLPSDAAGVTVVSFPWALDVPDLAREPFEPPFSKPLAVQVHHHVKSVGRLDSTLGKAHVHTFKTCTGSRLWVREPFPLVDAKSQVHGSMVTTDHWHSHWDELPEAFIFHAINRSEIEYLAAIAKGKRQSGQDLEFKSNRKGYLPTQAPVLTFKPPSRALRSYLRQRRSFHRQMKLVQPIATSQSMLLDRAEELSRRVQSNDELKRFLAVALEGTTLT